MSPMFFGEEIEVYTRCISMSEKSFVLLQVLREKNTGEVKSVCETVMVCYDPRRRESIQMPEQWRKDLYEYERHDIVDVRKHMQK